MERGDIRVQTDGLFEASFRLLFIVYGKVNRPQVVVGVGVLGIDPYGPVKRLDRIVIITKLRVGDTELVVDVLAVGIMTGGFEVLDQSWVVVFANESDVGLFGGFIRADNVLRLDGNMHHFRGTAGQKDAGKKRNLPAQEPSRV